MFSTLLGPLPAESEPFHVEAATPGEIDPRLENAAALEAVGLELVSDGMDPAGPGEEAEAVAARWIAVEDFLSEHVVRPDGSLKRAVSSALEAGLPPIEVAPTAGKLLKLLVQLSGARRVLEIGTLAGFSTIWMAQGLPDGGRLLTCEYLPKHARVARANVDAAIGRPGDSSAAAW